MADLISARFRRHDSAMTKSIVRIAVAAIFVALVAAPVRAQTANETKVLLDRITRLETELNQLERQVYSGKSSSSPSAGSPAAGGAPSGDAGIALNDRLDDLDGRIRDLTGRIEEINHQNKVLSDRLDKLVADVDFRFRALEKGGGADQGAAAPAAGQAAGAGPAQEGAAPPRNLGTLSAGDLKASDQQSALTPPQPVKLPQGPPHDQYNYATDLLHQGDYAGAEQALTQFIAQHPSDPLASPAQYWLGETFFVRQQYDRAAKAFLAGYQKYPKTTKAPDDLLKLGMSLNALSQKKESCAVYQQLATEYPNAEARIKTSLAREKSKAGCK